MPARNVLNHAEVDLFVEELTLQTQNPALARWLRTVLRRWILKHHDRYARVLRDPASDSFVVATAGAEDAAPALSKLEAVPDWCAPALARGDEVVILDLGATLSKRVRRAMKALEDNLSGVPCAGLERMSFPMAESVAREWRRRRYDARRQRRALRGVSPVFRAGQATVVRLKSAESLKEEGAKMRHCVGVEDYTRAVAQGDRQIYSLRDEIGRPQATMEVEPDGTLWQIKGHANGAVGEKYRPALQAFVRDRGYQVRSDAYNLLLRPSDYKTDVARLERYLISGGGLAWLRHRSWAAPEALRDAKFSTLLHTLAANARDLHPTVVSAVFAALAPAGEAWMRIAPLREVWAYDTRILVFRVSVPLALINLIKLGMFDRSGLRALAFSRCRALEGNLANLVLLRPDRLFVLGPAKAAPAWSGGLLESAAEVLRRSRIDVSRLRAERHGTLARHLNQAKRTRLGQRQAPSGTHLWFRQFIAGRTGEYVL